MKWNVNSLKRTSKLNKGLQYLSIIYFSDQYHRTNKTRLFLQAIVYVLRIQLSSWYYLSEHEQCVRRTATSRRVTKINGPYKCKYFEENGSRSYIGDPTRRRRSHSVKPIPAITIRPPWKWERRLSRRDIRNTVRKVKSHVSKQR